jgi:hypothetical protein
VSGPTEQLSQKEKLRTLLQDNWMRNRELREDVRIDNERKTNATTYSVFTESELNAEEGRFKKSSQVVGTRRDVSYPQLPASSPWSMPDPSGIEPALGVDINEAPVVGTHAEILRSICDLDGAGGGDDSGESSSHPTSKTSASVVLPSAGGSGTTSGMKTDVVPSPLAKRKL